MKILTVAEMRAAEARADAAGHSYATMMEQAGRGAAEALLARLDDPTGQAILILVGGGNNGGDGLVCAHYLSNAGASVAVYATRVPDAADPKVRRLREKGLLIADAEQDPDRRVLDRLLAQAGVVVDALVGTGARLPLGGAPAVLLGAVRHRVSRADNRPFVLAIDCPSGLDCDTGHCDPALVPADLTVTFAGPKRGFYAFPARARLGDVVVVDIGLTPHIDATALAEMDAATARALIPIRARDAHKGTFGRVLTIAGCRNYVGAGALAAESAYRVGAGLVELAPPASLWPTLAGLVPEAIGLALHETDGAISVEAAAQLAASLDKATAILLGPGLGSAPATAQFVSALVEALAARDRGGLIVDADGLRHLAVIDGWAAKLPPGAVLTPHPGEFAALTGLSTADIQKDRVGVAQRLAAAASHVVLLKGAFTVIAAPDGATTLLPFATPALARAGSGDVLSGLIVGLLAQGLDGYAAARVAGWLHGRAAELATERLGTTSSVLARDVVAAVPAALAELAR